VRSSVVGDFFRWWTSELRSLSPTARARAPQSARRIVLSPVGDKVNALLEHRGRHEPVRELGAGEGLTLSDLGPALRSLPRHLRHLPVSIRVRASDCHERVVALPAIARDDFDRLLLLDLERTTPLKKGDLLRAHIVEGALDSGGMVQVRQLLLKLRTIEPLRQTLRAAGIEPISIERWSHDGNGALATSFVGTAPSALPPTRRRLSVGLAATAALLMLTAFAIHWTRHERALATLTEQAAELEARVDELRRVTEDANTARSKILHIRRFVGSRHSTLPILEEITRLLPDTAWLEEFRLDGEFIEIAGLAASATTLLPLLEKSPLFRETRFTAPLQFDQALDKDRFRLRARLRSIEPDIPNRRAEVTR
jgi:general secretion pathway protein L